MRTISLSQKTQRIFMALLVVIFALKLAYMLESPVLDPSEARYAEMSRKMVETGDWISPQIDYGVWFWGKPPLSTWGSAAGIAIFGANEFGARFPVFVVTVAMMWMLYAWIRDLRNKDTAFLSIVLMACVPIFYYLSDAAMTDMFLCAVTMLTIVSFHRSVTGTGSSKLWPWMFFVGVGLALLTKGPAAVVLAALPIFFWTLTGNRWLLIWEKLPWIKGTILALVIAAPWYYIAETKTPGFIEYFIVGEHFNRFVVEGWEGDKYGSAHHEPKGTIWVFWLLTAIPWSIATIYFMIKYAVKAKQKDAVLVAAKDDSGLLSFLFFCAFAPMLFFTMASNIIPTYVLTGIPVLPFFLLELHQRTRGEKPGFSKPVKVGFSIAVALLMVVFVFVWIGPAYFPMKSPKSTAKHVVKKFDAIAEEGAQLHYWYDNRNYSAQFYSDGKAILVKDASELLPLLENGKRDYIAKKNDHKFPLPLAEKFERVGGSRKQSLYREINAE